MKLVNDPLVLRWDDVVRLLPGKEAQALFLPNCHETIPEAPAGEPYWAFSPLRNLLAQKVIIVETEDL